MRQPNGDYRVSHPDGSHWYTVPHIEFVKWGEQGAKIREALKESHDKWAKFTQEKARKEADDADILAQAKAKGIVSRLVHD